jgi:hypothetical protein
VCALHVCVYACSDWHCRALPIGARGQDIESCLQDYSASDHATAPCTRAHHLQPASTTAASLAHTRTHMPDRSLSQSLGESADVRARALGGGTHVRRDACTYTCAAEAYTRA